MQEAVMPVPRFDVHQVQTSADLSRLLAAEPGRATAVADLTLGSWTAQSLATQWLGQLLGKEVSYKSSPRVTQFRSLGDAMCSGIDEEGKGNRDVMTALSSARQIVRVAGRLSARLFLLCPRFDFTWRNEDRLLVEYMRDLMPVLELGLVVTGTCSPWPAQWNMPDLPPQPAAEPSQLSSVLALVPAALPPSVQGEHMPKHVTLDNGWAIVAPEERRDPRGRFGTDELAKLQQIGAHRYLPYAYYQGIVPPDPWFMCIEGWKQCYAGYRDVGLFYVDAAEKHAKTEEDVYVFRAHGQAMRLALARYRDAAAVPDPDREIASETVRMLDQIKGWSLVMEGDAERAIVYLRRALESSQPDPRDKAHLFLMNVTALAELRCSNSERALALEKEIEQSVSLMGDNGADLKFVNSMNLARLYRYARDYARSETYYRSAFDTCDGARTDTDAVNVNLCMSRLDRARGAHNEELLSLVRAAMQWCSSDSPEALNWRVQSLLIGSRRCIAIGSLDEAIELVELLAKSFLDELEQLSRACNRAVPLAREAVLRPFAQADPNLGSLRAVRCVGGTGWGVIAAAGERAVRRYGPRYDALVRWLDAWIEAAVGVSDETCYVVDRRNGSEMATTWMEVVGSAIDFAVNEVRFDSRSLVLDASQILEMRRLLRLRVNPMVSLSEEKNGVRVATFKRYLPSLSIAPSERLLVELAERGATLGTVYDDIGKLTGSNPSQIDSTIANLRKNRVVQVIAGDEVAARLEAV